MNKTIIYLNGNKIIEVEKLIEFECHDVVFVNNVKSVCVSRDDSYNGGSIETSVHFKPLFELEKECSEIKERLEPSFKEKKEIG